MKSLKGLEIDVKEVVEKPEIHIVGCSSSLTQQQLLFSETRRECLQHMKETMKTQNGIELYDILSFFYGDGPAAQFEADHKQGGGDFAALAVLHTLLDLQI